MLRRKPDDLLVPLEAAHKRIEQELAALERLAGNAAPGGARAQTEAKRLLDYFDGAAAQHHASEDEGLFPLLRAQAAAAGRAEVAAAIDELEREHGTMEALWGRVRDELLALAAKKEARLPAGEVERFAWLTRRHMEREDLLILPFAREVLAAGDLAGMRK